MVNPGGLRQQAQVRSRSILHHIFEQLAVPVRRDSLVSLLPRRQI